MTSRLRWVFSTCALASVVLAAPAAQSPLEMPRVRIVVNSSAPQAITVDSQKVRAQTRGTVTFVIENRDKVPHVVRIPIREFKPKQTKEYEKEGLATDIVPFTPPRSQRVTVKAGGVGELVYRIKPGEAFGFNKRNPWKKDRAKGDRSRGMTYKYNIYTFPSGAKDEIALDPDIEVRQP
jgi:hypothetical protein